MAMEYAPGKQAAGGAAEFDLYFWELGCWHMHGSHQPWTQPYKRLRHAIEAAVALSRGCGLVILRLHNRSNGEPVPVEYVDGPPIRDVK